MKSLPSRRFSRFGVSRSAGRSASAAPPADVAPSAGQSSVEVSDPSITTAGNTTVTVTVRNAAGTLLQGVAVTPAATGSNNTFSPTDDTTNASGVATFTYSSSTAEAKTVSALAGAVSITDTAAVTVSTPGSEVTPLFASDWRTATGSGASALLDTSGITAPLVWTTEGGANVVVANSALGFPAGPTNVLHVPGDTGGIIRVTGMGAQSTGDERYYRLYFRDDLPYPTTDNQTHPFQDGNAGSDSNWAIDLFNGAVLNYTSADATYYRIGINFPETQAAWYENLYCGPLLERGTVYLLEWVVWYTTSSTLNMDIRISDADGVLLYTSDDFYDARGAAAGRELSTRNGSGTFAARSGHGISESDGLNVGTNDVYAEFAPTYGYQAAVAVADNQGWIGVYGNVTGE